MSFYKTAVRHDNAGTANLNNLQTNYSHFDPVEQFKNAMLDAGVSPPENIVADGGLHRFKINGKPNGAYVLHVDCRPAGFFQDFKRGVKVFWKMSGDRKVYSDAERHSYKMRCIEQEKQRQESEALDHAKAAKTSLYLWKKAVPAPENHPYLSRKRINPYGARLYRECLVIRIFDERKQLVNLQFISRDGVKRFLKGGKKKACFSVIGEANEFPIDVCEGFSTGVSLYEMSRNQTVIALDCGNLEAVARVCRKLYPDRAIHLYGDNDKSGIGQLSAESAASAVGGRVFIPEKVGQDWNDVFCEMLDEVNS